MMELLSKMEPELKDLENSQLHSVSSPTTSHPTQQKTRMTLKAIQKSVFKRYVDWEVGRITLVSTGHTASNKSLENKAAT